MLIVFLYCSLFWSCWVHLRLHQCPPDWWISQRGCCPPHNNVFFTKISPRCGNQPQTKTLFWIHALSVLFKLLDCTLWIDFWCNYYYQLAITLNYYSYFPFLISHSLLFYTQHFSSILKNSNHRSQLHYSSNPNFPLWSKRLFLQACSNSSNLIESSGFTCHSFDLRFESAISS